MAIFESKSSQLLPRGRFLARMAGCFLITLLICGVSLAIGTAGYHYCGGLEWIDAFQNASMILTGMGPIDPMRTVQAKLFAAFYALYSGVAFLTMVAVIMAPVAHRVLHSFHLDDGED